VNNSSDDTAAAARRLAPALPFPLAVEAVDLPPDRAHAGGARRRALASAARLLAASRSPVPVLLSTDADAEPAADWVSGSLAEIDGGADAVAGSFDVAEAELDRLPAAVRRRHECEQYYAALLDQIESLVDPLPWDPWPRHGDHSGASFAVRLDAYLRVGGVPAVAAGEDRAFFARLQRRDRRVRHSPAVRVTVSARLQGRALEGMAATLRRRVDDAAAPWDPRLEPLDRLLVRWRLRRTFRHLWRGRVSPALAPGLARQVDVAEGSLLHALQRQHFGSAWAWLERRSRILAPDVILPHGLEAEIAAAERLLDHLLGLRPPEEDPDGSRSGAPDGRAAWWSEPTE